MRALGGTMNKKVLALVRIAGVASLLLASVSASAQFRASIQGTVTDPQNAVIAGAQLTLKDLGTNRVLTATSDPSGVYNFGALPADHFRSEEHTSELQSLRHLVC